jgi:hypothetical protein
MTETEDVEKLAEKINALMPQVESINMAFQPMMEMFKAYLGQIGIDMKVGAVYLKKRGKLIYGIIFEGPQENLEKLIPMMGGIKNVGETEEKEE